MSAGDLTDAQRALIALGDEAFRQNWRKRMERAEAQIENVKHAERRMRDVARWFPQNAEVWIGAANEIHYALTGEGGCGLAEVVASAPAEHCCPHDFDAHDGSGCIDCRCNWAPWSAGPGPHRLAPPVVAPSATDEGGA